MEIDLIKNVIYYKDRNENLIENLKTIYKWEFIIKEMANNTNYISNDTKIDTEETNEYIHIDDLLTKAEKLISETSLGHKSNNSVLTSKINSQAKKYTNDLLVKTIPSTIITNMHQKANKKTAFETKKNNLFSSTLTKRPTVNTNSAHSNTQNLSVGKEISSKSTKNGEGLVYKGILRFKKVISTDKTDFSFQKYFSSLSENNLLINFEIQSRRKRKKVLFVSNLENKSLNSDRTVSNSNSIKLFNLYMSNKCLIKQEIALIQKDQTNDAKCIYIYVLNPHVPEFILKYYFRKN
jgi:hypothetical protein